MIRRAISPFFSHLRKLEVKAGVKEYYQSRVRVRQEIELRLMTALLTNDELNGLIAFWDDHFKQPKDERGDPPDPPGALGEALRRCQREAEAAYARGVRARPDLLLSGLTDAKLDAQRDDAEAPSSACSRPARAR